MPEQPITPPLTDYQPPDGATPICGWYTTEPETACDAIATWHILWSATETTAHGGAPATFECTTHMDQVKALFAYHDRHPVGPNCGMPGTWWSPAEQRCGIPATEPTPGEEPQ